MRRPLPWLPLILLILLLSAGLRFHRLGAQSLWYDEGVAWRHATRSLPELIPRLQNNVHVPAYFAALGAWEDAAGDSEFALRSFSAFASLLAIAATYALGMRLFHPLAGLAAAAFLSLNSFSIYYAQEARMYAMLTAVATFNFWLFAGMLRRLQREDALNQRRDIVILGSVNALGMYTHVAFALVILAQLAAALFWLIDGGNAPRRRKAFIPLISAFGISALLFTPWLPTSLRQVFSQPNIAHPIAADTLLRRILEHLTLGGAAELTLPIGLALALLLIAGLSPRRGIWRMLLPLCLVLLSVALYLALDLGERYTRFLLPAGVGMALWLGRGCWIMWSVRLPNRAWLSYLTTVAALILAGAILITQFMGLPDLFHHPAFQRDDLRGLTHRIESDLGENDSVIVSAAGLEEALRYYYRADAPVYGLPTSADSAETRARVRDIIAAHDQIHVIFYGSAEQDPEGSVEAALNAAAFEISDQWVDDLRYAHYATTDDLPAPMPLNARFGDSIDLLSVRMSDATLSAGDVILVQFSWRTDTALDARYKVFLQLLDAEGKLAAQRDTEPGGGLSLTIDWQPGVDVIDNHGLLLPAELSEGEYALIAGLYDFHDPLARLMVNGADHVPLARFGIAQADPRS